MSNHRRPLVDIFDQTRRLVKHADKTAWLREHASPTLFYTLFLAFSPHVEWLLPEGAPPFKPWGEGRRKLRAGSEPSDLRNELRRIYLFLKDSPTHGRAGSHVPQLRREKLFQNVLETISAEDVELLVAIKDKTFSKKYRFPEKLLEETFPGLLDAPFRLRFIR